MTTRHPRGLCGPEMVCGGTAGNVYRNEAQEAADELRAQQARIDGYLRVISCAHDRGARNDPRD